MLPKPRTGGLCLDKRRLPLGVGQPRCMSALVHGSVVRHDAWGQSCTEIFEALRLRVSVLDFGMHGAPVRPDASLHRAFMPRSRDALHGSDTGACRNWLSHEALIHTAGQGIQQRMPPFFSTASMLGSHGSVDCIVDAGLYDLVDS
mgnify:FL=1